MTTDLAFLSATELLAGYRRRRFSPVEVAQAALAQIDRYNATYNAFCLVDHATTKKQASASEARWMRGEPCGLIDGVPTSIKDLLISKGWPTLRGSKTISANQDWSEDAPAVARLREQGAVFIGKTTTPEYGWKPLTDSPLTGITRNPWNSELTPGGSSGGASAAAALGMGALHIGTDAAGSIRIPSAFTGIFGLKPTHGRVPAYPLTPNSAFAHVGPMTRTVEDAALMLTAMLGYDPRDPYALPFDARDWRIGVDQGLKGLRIAYAPTLSGAPVEPRIAALVRSAVDELADLGAVVEQAEPPIAGAGAGLTTLYRISARTLVGSMSEQQQQLIDPTLRAFATESASVGFTEYLDALRARERLTAALNGFFQTYDLFVTPTVPIVAFKAGELVPPGGQYKTWFEWTPFSAPFNFTKAPAASIPCGQIDGLPVGLQFVAALYREDLVLRAARAYEARHPVEVPTPK
jgi:aspartyl-tRNA(Asn)/glutamyl-tRNA(Gln) amidotransferase subunit A